MNSINTKSRQDTIEPPQTRIKEFSTFLAELRKREIKSQQKEPIEQTGHSEEIANQNDRKVFVQAV